MKKILFVSAAALALVLSSCKKDAAQAEGDAQKTEAQKTENAAASQEAPKVENVENGVLKDLKAQLEAIKASAENASADAIPVLFDQMKALQEAFEAAKANLSDSEQAEFSAAANAVVELIKSKK